MMEETDKMIIKTFKGFENVYLDKIEESNSWYYIWSTPCSEPYEVPDFKNNYPGTRLCFIEYPSGIIFEPIKQKRNVYIERPFYEPADNLFGVICYDFNKEVLQVLVFYPGYNDIKILTEIPFLKCKDMVNIRLEGSPFTLVKHNIHDDAVDFLWPKENHFQFERNESLCFLDDGKMYTSKWIEDPDYHEEMIIRNAETGEIVERSPGYFRRMPDGSIWKITP